VAFVPPPFCSYVGQKLWGPYAAACTRQSYTTLPAPNKYAFSLEGMLEERMPLWDYRAKLKTGENYLVRLVVTQYRSGRGSSRAALLPKFAYCGASLSDVSTLGTDLRI